MEQQSRLIGLDRLHGYSITQGGSFMTYRDTRLMFENRRVELVKW